jgi:alpha/beta superfamily hydrolase
MVRRGEFLERMVVIPSGALTLEGLYHRGTLQPPLVVAAPHPRMGGSMDSPVVQEIAWAVTRAGHPTLRFNYRGVGASQGAWSGGEGELADLHAAIEQLLASTGAAAVAIAGYSFGAHLALQAARSRADASHLLLVAPPTSLFDFGELPLVRARTLVVVPEHDALAGAALPAGAVPVQVVPGAEHGFQRGLPAVGKAAVALLAGLAGTTPA